MTAGSTSRRSFLRIGTALALAAGEGARAGPPAAAAERALGEIWRRFVDKRFDVLLHYAGRDGEVVFPSAEDCAECRPNGMGWSTPVEDGPFFGGLFLDGLCNRWHGRRDEESADAARRIAGGLMRLAELSPLPGFVPRGIAADGRACYPASSEDQLFPWFYGLWRYLRSALAGSDRGRIEDKLRETVLALESHGWRVPCADAAFGYRGTYLRATAHDAARLLFVLQAMHRLTGEERWKEEYHRRLNERIGARGLTRREICAEGLDYGGRAGEGTYVWTHSMSQAALRALADAEEDGVASADFRRGLLASAAKALPHLDRARRYDRDNGLCFDADWRFLNASWKPQRTCDDAIALARSQLPLWAEHNPRGPYEDDVVREPLFAAWIVLLAGDPGMDRVCGSRIDALLERYDWSSLHTSTFFVAVNIRNESFRPRGF